MDIYKAAEILHNLTGADEAIVAEYISKNGLVRFMSDFSAIEGITDEAKERLDDLYLYVLEVLNNAKG